MNTEKIMYRIRDIIEKLNDLERSPLGSLWSDIEVIRWEVEALRNDVEEALEEATR